MAEQWEAYLRDNSDRFLEELKDLVRIPSISTLPQHDPDTRRAAEWMAERLRQAGVPRVELVPTERNPVVFGEWHVDDSQPTAMIYGHYDVQPPDPLDLWDSPPFEPEVRDDKLYGRGATDDKGNALAAVQAVEALARTQGGPKINLKFFFEGEEEVGSPSMPGFVNAERERLACDFVISADGSMFGPEEPSLSVSSKGLAACQIDLRTSATDLHSGQYGAAVPNAVHQLVHLAASFHTNDGRVAIAGFYDNVRDLTPEEREEVARIPFDEEAYRQSVGAPALWGEAGWSPLERAWARPTVDFNGIWGGFQGEGNKTVTPSEAHLKITCRLVANQEPEAILDLIERHVEQHCPPTAVATVQRSRASARPFMIRADHPALQTAAQVLRDLYGREPLVTRVGGTVPVAEIFQQQLGADMVFFAWGMPDSRVHAPNESYRLEAFAMERRAYCTYLNALAR
jgi:acetylornithine deacetylase/succinyl-diaminopimelate desuccinylase-like protein